MSWLKKLFETEKDRELARLRQQVERMEHALSEIADPRMQNPQSMKTLAVMGMRSDSLYKR